MTIIDFFTGKRIMKDRKGNSRRGATPRATARPLRVLLCDDQKLIRTRVRKMLEETPFIQVAGEAAGGRSGVSQALKLKPDVVLMDVSMPDLDGIEATRQIVAQLPRIRVLAFSAEADEEGVRRMFAAGAHGYLLKTGDAVELMTALRKVFEGESFVSARVSRSPNWPRPD